MRNITKMNMRSKKRRSKYLFFISTLVVTGLLSLFIFLGLFSILDPFNSDITGRAVTDVESDNPPMPGIVLQDQYVWNGHYKLIDNYDATFDLEIFTGPRVEYDTGMGTQFVTTISKAEIRDVPKSQQNKITTKIYEASEEPVASEIFAVEEDFLFDEAILTLRKTKNVDYIIACQDFNLINFECDGSWELTDTPFVDNGNTIVFEVPTLTAYAGGRKEDSSKFIPPKIVPEEVEEVEVVEVVEVVEIQIEEPTIIEDSVEEVLVEEPQLQESRNIEEKIILPEPEQISVMESNPEPEFQETYSFEEVPTNLVYPYWWVWMIALLVVGFVVYRTKLYAEEHPVKIRMPKLHMPKIKVPKVHVPKINVPKMKVPKIHVPKINLPKVHVPKISVPKIAFPTILKHKPKKKHRAKLKHIFRKKIRSKQEPSEGHITKKDKQKIKKTFTDVDDLISKLEKS